jgi:hypothetical protein
MSCYPVPRRCRGRPAATIEHENRELCRYQASRHAPDRNRGIARLAYACARRAGIELKPLWKKAGLTDQQIKDRGARLAVADALQRAGDANDRYHCTGIQVQRYRARISGPLLDRLDLHVYVPRVELKSLREPSGCCEASAEVAARVMCGLERRRRHDLGVVCRSANSIQHVPG